MAQELDTRTRLLDAAGHVFAERGFKAATIREIVDRAGANLAAVNYHFGDKEGLYSEVLLHSAQSGLREYPPDGGVPAEAPAEERLEGFIRNFLLRSLGVCGHQAPEPGAPLDWRGRLMAREMADPTPHMHTVIERLLRPVVEHLGQILADVTHRGLPDRQTWLCANSIIAQCVFYKHWEQVGERLHPGLLPPMPERVDLLAEHITRFSLAALRGMAAEESR